MSAHLIKALLVEVRRGDGPSRPAVTMVLCALHFGPMKAIFDVVTEGTDMRKLPVTYRIPRDLMRYAVMAAVVTTAILGGALWATFVAGEIQLVAVLIVTAGWIFILVQCRSIGTTVTKDGIVRNGFLGDQRLAWQDITELAVQDRHAGVSAYGFQVASRYVVTVGTRHRPGKLTLLFLDERAFDHDGHALVTEVGAIGALWEHHRNAGTTH